MDTAAALPIADGPPLERRKNGHSRRQEQLDQAQESGLAILSAISSYLDADEELPAFIGRICAMVAEQTGATRAAFWRIGRRGTLSVQPAAFGFSEESVIHTVRFPLGSAGDGPIERLIFADRLRLVKGTAPQLDELWHASGIEEVQSSIGAAWRMGDRRIGAITAFDAPGGFSAADVWLLRMAGMAAGLLWQYKEAEEDLGQTAVRLEEAMTARRHLLNNIAAGGDEARRRFASALHDDSLQLLTGAELQLERLRGDLNGRPEAAQLDQLKQTLRKVEDSLRRLLINVSPEPVTMPSDLRGAISERLDLMRVRAGIEAQVDTRLPDNVPLSIQSIVVKNISEALNNVEKHARATHVTVVAEEAEGGIRVEVTDDGTGFVVAESVQMPGHIGLVALRERAQLAGGTCRIESEPGTGTRVEFWVPMKL